MQFQFLAPSRIIFVVKELQFLTRVELFLFEMYSFPVRGLSCLHLIIKKGTFKHQGLEQYTSWKVRVPDCVFSMRNEQT